MAQLLVRNLDNETKEKLRTRAARNGHSMEAEVRLIIDAALNEPYPEEDIGTQIARIMEGNWTEFEIPKFTEEDWGLFEFPEE